MSLRACMTLPRDSSMPFALHTGPDLRIVPLSTHPIPAHNSWNASLVQSLYKMQKGRGRKGQMAQGPVRKEEESAVLRAHKGGKEVYCDEMKKKRSLFSNYMDKLLL
ncbi:hypothetical protein CLAIMM_00444, partial [Cladophialophora immunda]